MERFMSVVNLFPVEMRSALLGEISRFGCVPEEIRIRVGSPIRLRRYGGELVWGEPVTKEQLMCVVGNAAEGSYHTAVKHIQNGYIPLRYGGRMGVCGNGTDGSISSFGEISSVCIRIAAEAKGSADEVYETLYEQGLCNAIIIAPPGAGKTTLLRELVRKLSYSGMYVGVADERGEIAGMYRDKPTFDLGPRCDVLSGVPKNRSAMMLLRAMSPEVIAMDEITAYTDGKAIMEAVGCGVGLLATMHGDGLRSIHKPAFRQLYETMVFDKAVFVSVINGERVYRVVELYDKAVRRGIDCNDGCYDGQSAVNGNEKADCFTDDL